MSTSAPDLRAIIFDIGGIFVGLNFDRSIGLTAAAAGCTPEEVRAKLFGNGDGLIGRLEFLHDFECGRSDEQRFHGEVETLLGCRIPFATFAEAWGAALDEPCEEVIAIARTLLETQARHGLKLCILSNNNTLHWEILRARIPLLERFEHLYLSHQIGKRKPHAEAFLHALEKMNVAPEATLFIDDLEENIAAARALGIQTLHARTPTEVREGLKRMGIVTS